jgi:hypothetical protein
MVEEAFRVGTGKKLQGVARVGVVLAPLLVGPGTIREEYHIDKSVSP